MVEASQDQEGGDAPSARTLSLSSRRFRCCSRWGGTGGPRRDARAVIAGLPRASAATLTSEQIAARAGITRPLVARTLAALEAEGKAGRRCGRPRRRYPLADLGEAA